jgi:hypothetical protein
MPDLQGYAGQYTLGSSSPKATGSMLAQQPWIFPTPDNFPLPTLALCYLLAWPSWSLLSLPLSSIDFPCDPLSLYTSVLIQLGVFNWWLSLLATCSRWFLVRGLSTLKMEVTRSSETSVHTRYTRRHIPETGNVHSQRCENLKSYIKSRLHYLSLPILRDPTNLLCFIFLLNIFQVTVHITKKGHIKDKHSLLVLMLCWQSLLWEPHIQHNTIETD